VSASLLFIAKKTNQPATSLKATQTKTFFANKLFFSLLDLEPIVQKKKILFCFSKKKSVG